MGFRTKDEVIYSRVTGKTRREFHKQMEESGYKSSSDFIEYPTGKRQIQNRAYVKISKLSLRLQQFLP